MNVSSETSGAIEAALDQFEDQWLSGEYRPDVISEVAGLRQLTGFAERRVPWELAMCDLELRWRYRDPLVRLGSRWYAEQLGPLGLTAADVDELCLHELIVRSRWADRPPLAALLDEQFPGLAGDARRRRLRRMVEHLELHFPIQCVVKADGGKHFRAEVPSPCIFGRQRSSDPPPGGPHRDVDSGNWRMIVTPREHNRVSRNQLLVDRVAVHQLSVQSLSEDVSCYLDGKRLPIDHPVTVEVGARSPQLRFHNITLRLFAEI